MHARRRRQESSACQGILQPCRIRIQLQGSCSVCARNRNRCVVVGSLIAKRHVGASIILQCTSRYRWPDSVLRAATPGSDTHTILNTTCQTPDSMLHNLNLLDLPNPRRDPSNRPSNRKHPENTTSNHARFPQRLDPRILVGNDDLPIADLVNDVDGGESECCTA